MSGHTPGTWESRDGEITTKQIEGRSFQRIAAIPDYGVGSLREVDEANARLMAAAPELLAALKDLMELYAIGQLVIEGEVEQGDDPVIKAAWAAINKAEGRAE